MNCSDYHTKCACDLKTAHLAPGSCAGVTSSSGPPYATQSAPAVRAGPAVFAGAAAPEQRRQAAKPAAEPGSEAGLGVQLCPCGAAPGLPGASSKAACSSERLLLRSRPWPQGPGLRGGGAGRGGQPEDNAGARLASACQAVCVEGAERQFCDPARCVGQAADAVKSKWLFPPS